MFDDIYASVDDPISIEVVVVTPGGGGSSGEVTAEKLTYDLPQVHPTPTVTDALGPYVPEVHPTPVEDAGAGLLFTDLLTPTAPVDTATLVASVLTEIAPNAGDAATLIPVVSETQVAAIDAVTLANTVSEIAPDPTETPTAIVRGIANETHVDAVDASTIATVVAEVEPDAVDFSTLETTALEVNPNAVDTVALATTSLETHPAITDENSIVLAGIFDVSPDAVDLATLATTALEIHPATSEETPIAARLIINEIAVDATDAAAIAAVIAEVAAAAGDAGTVLIDMQWLWADAVVSNAGAVAWASTANIIDKSDTTAATLAATSSGIVPGTTSNTSNGNLVVSMPSPILTDLTITAVTFQIRTECLVTAGTPLLSQAHNMAYDYSVNDGSSWTTAITKTAFPETLVTDSFDLTSVVGTDWTKINQFRARAVGSVTSGTGVASNVTVTERWYLARVRIQASKTY